MLAWAEVAEVGGIFYKIDGNTNTAAVTYHHDKGGFNYPDVKGIVEIPATISVKNTNYTVIEIASSAFESCEEIEGAILPSSIKKIGNYAFCECLKFKSITLPGDLAEIGIGVFANTSLKAVELTGNITAIKENTFASTDIETITLPESVITIEKNAFSYCGKLREINIGNSITSIGDGAFKSCKALCSINFPEALRSIGKQAFNSCQALTSLNFNKITNIGEKAFEKCTALADIDFGSGELTIGYSAFAECPAIKKLEIPANVVKLGQYAFYNCLGLESVRFDDGDTTIELGYAPFANDPMTELYIGRSVSTTGKNDNPFSSNKSLARLIIGDGMKTITPELFSYMSALEEVDFGANVTWVGYEAFASCPKLKTVKCGDVADWIKIDFEDADANPLNYGADLYINNVLLTTLDIPEGPTKIGENVFPNYSRLTEITIPATVNSIGQQAFMDCSSLRKVDFQGSVAAIGGRAFRNCTALAEVHCPSLQAWLGNGFETALSNPLNYGAKLYAADKLIEDIYTPSGTIAIGDYAFCNYSLISNAVINESVSEIGRSAFQGCTSLTEVELGADVTLLCKKAFDGTPLATITSRNPEPPTFDLASTTATFSNYNATVYVPAGSLDAYRNNSCWKNFANIIEKDLSGIDNVAISGETPFTINGDTVSAKTA